MTNRWLIEFFQSYQKSLKKALSSGKYQEADLILEELHMFQQNEGGSILPSSSKISAEIILNDSRVFLVSQASIPYWD